MIDPRQPDFADTPVAGGRAGFRYAARGGGAVTGPVVTVVTPVHNGAGLLHETAACVLGQSLQNIEWVIVNDGSTDAGALGVLEGYRTADPRVRVVDHGRNLGLSAARNTGFAHARADLVFQLDADDLIEPTTLEKLAWFLGTHPEYAFAKGYTVGFGAEEYLWARGFHEGAAFLNENLVTATAMVRKSVHGVVGGYDETIRGGLEDWEFWLRCASRGYWGATIPEYLDWYRRRERSAGEWSNLEGEARRAGFGEMLRERFAGLYEGQFPWIAPRWQLAYDAVPMRPAFENPLAKVVRRVVMVVPWLTLGGADKFNRNAVEQLVARGWEVTVVTTLPGDHSWMPEFSRHTPDVLAMQHFVKHSDRPVFLRYVIESRRPEVVMVSNSELGYLLLPYLRAHCPEPAYVDYCHMEEEYWKNGGHPRCGAAYQPHLDRNIVSSAHLREWMTRRGAEGERIDAVHTSEDTELWRPDAGARAAVREAKGLGAEEVVILYAGRVVAQKQPRVFGRVVRELEERGCEFRAVVAGTGDELAWLEAYVAEHGLEGRVMFLGAVASGEMPGLMAASDIFFLPSLWEGIALSVYEAMSVGLAVVTADVGGQRELVTEECGILHARGSEEEEVARYAGDLERLIGDAGARARMGRCARERIERHFKLTDMGEGLVAAFERARAAAGEPGRVILDRAVVQEVATLAVEYVRTFALSESLWNERDILRSAVQKLGASRNGRTGEGGGLGDARGEARRIVEANLRYRLADRVNEALKTFGIHRPLKAITMRTLRVVRGKK